MPFKGFKIKTENGINTTLEYSNGETASGGKFYVRETDSTLKSTILGKEALRPRVDMPLIIFLNSTDILYSSRIKEVKPF